MDIALPRCLALKTEVPKARHRYRVAVVELVCQIQVKATFAAVYSVLLPDFLMCLCLTVASTSDRRGTM